MTPDGRRFCLADLGIPATAVLLGVAFWWMWWAGREPCWEGPLRPGHIHIVRPGGNIDCFVGPVGREKTGRMTVIWAPTPNLPDDLETYVKERSAERKAREIAVEEEK